MIVLIVYALIILGLGIYSFALLDPSLTLISHPLFESFRDIMVNYGFILRKESWMTYLVLLTALYVFHVYFMTTKKRYNAFYIALMIGVLLVFSYPFLSRDFFNYLFDARIFTFYGKSPYLYKALDFPNDAWLRFMHWTHRTYPYGPTFLPITLIPSFIAFGKFILNFVFFKMMFSFFYVISVYFLNKMNKTWALFFATHPYILIEGVINTHNDLMAVAFAIIGIYFLFEKRKYFSRLFLFISAGIKYITFPLVILVKPKKNKNTINAYLSVIGISIIIGYLSFFKEVQQWYFLNYFALLPFFYSHIKKAHIFFFGLLLSYYPFIRLGGWEKLEHVTMKHTIIFIFLGINLLYIALLKTRRHLL